MRNFHSLLILFTHSNTLPNLVKHTHTHRHRHTDTHTETHTDTQTHTQKPMLKRKNMIDSHPFAHSSLNLKACYLELPVSLTAQMYDNVCESDMNKDAFER